MDAGRQGWKHRKALDILIGIEAGILGVVVMIAFFLAISPILNESWWTYPNLFASRYYSRSVTHYGPGWVTVSGVGLLFFWGGLVGAFQGLVAPRGRFGQVFGLLWCAFGYLFVWRKYAPGVIRSASPAVLVAGFFLYGCLLRWQGRLRGYTLGPGPEPPPVPEPHPAVDAPGTTAEPVLAEASRTPAPVDPAVPHATSGPEVTDDSVPPSDHAENALQEQTSGHDRSPGLGD